MTSNVITRLRPRLLQLIGVMIFALMFLLVATADADAQDAGQDTVEAGCMEDLAGRNLNCTANDVRLSSVTDLVITNPCRFPGDLVTFSATFETLLTAQERHDIGIYFAIDGDPNDDGALTGACSVSTLHYTEDPPWLDLDGTTDNYAGTKIESGIQDTCGDIDADHNPLFPNITVTTVCVDDDGDGSLDLPYCTSWRQPGSNELCTGPLPEDVGAGSSSGVFPGSPSKCKCDPGFNVPVPVPPGTITVIKGAVDDENPPGDLVATVPEPGADVVFDVSVTNDSLDPAAIVTIDTLSDSVYGDITDADNPAIVSTTCSVPQDIIGGGTYTCSFTAFVAGNAGDMHSDTVTASGLDNRTPPNGPNGVSDSDPALVLFSDVAPTIDLIKGNIEGNDKVGSVNEPGGSIVFDVSIKNTSVSTDPVTLTSLNDVPYGDITQVQGDVTATTCVLGTIQPGDTYTCSFTAFVAGNAGDMHSDTVTASGLDNRTPPNGPNGVSDSDPALVLFSDVAPTIDLIKGNIEGNDKVGSVNEPGGSIVFDVSIKNTSVSTDPVTLTSLNDVPYGDITEVQGDVTATTCGLGTIQPGLTYTCSFTANVNGQGDTNQVDTLTAIGYDDEGITSAEDSDQANVDINDVAPTIDLIKGNIEGNDKVGSVNEPGGSIVFDVSIKNTSESGDPVTLTSLNDVPYGDITEVQGDVTATTCGLVTIQPGLTYTCSFTANVNGEGNTNQVDTLTAIGYDDEGITSAEDSDQANVDINDVPPAASLEKIATKSVVTFQVTVWNDSTVESLTLDVLVDDVFGDITQVQGNVLVTTCSVPQTLAIEGSYTCTFDGEINESPHTDTVTGTVSDNEGGSVTPSDSAVVKFE